MIEFGIDNTLLQAKLSKLQELGLTGRSPAVDDEALEGVPNPSAIDADTGKTLRRTTRAPTPDRKNNADRKFFFFSFFFFFFSCCFWFGAIGGG